MAYRPAIRALLLCGLAFGGCESDSSDLYRKFQGEDPRVRIAAAVEASDTKNPRAVPYLVDRLEDPEADVRFFSFLALKKITGKTMDWRYYDPPAARGEAVERWRQWLRQGRDEAYSDGENGSKQ